MTQSGYSSGAESFVQFLTVFLVFLLVLALTYFTTRFVGAFQKQQGFNRNFEAVETYKITNGKYLQIVRVGDKYVVIGIAKDSVTKICELTEEELVLTQDKPAAAESFKDMLSKARDRFGKGGN